MGVVVCRWIMGAAAGLAGVSGCRVLAATVRWARRRGSSVAVCVGQTALDGELHQLVIAQVTIGRIILEGQTGTC